VSLGASHLHALFLKSRRRVRELLLALYLNHRSRLQSIPDEKNLTASGNIRQDIFATRGNFFLIIFAARGKLRGMSDAELTTADVAARLDSPERTVRLWCKQGRFEGARAVSTPRGDYWIIPASALKTFQKPERGRPTTKAKASKKGGKK
jgi:hypothetical protein